ncbi:MAG TPA: MOSC domain-containing protein [Ktedonobacterales bacterium]|nr:MOSC domain-containing protein [Ktedonobacterales bacterium]
MRVISVNVGQPREVLWHGEPVLTSIFKEPVSGPVRLEPDNLAGDRQADLSVHGGPAKAVYVYPAGYYDAWRRELPEMALPWGMFGENLTLAGVSDQTVAIGDRLRIGTAELVVTQPRLPCYKLGIRFGRDTFLKQFLASGRTGFYLAIARAGEISAGDVAAIIARDPRGVTVAEIVRLYVRGRSDVDAMRRAVAVPALAAEWRGEFTRRLERLQAAPDLDDKDDDGA